MLTGRYSLLFALTTIVFAYYYHSALVADTATHLPSRNSLATAARPATAMHKEKASPVDVEANHPKEAGATAFDKESSGLVGKIASSLGTLKSPLRKDNLPHNDSAVFGVAGKHGIEVSPKEAELEKAEGSKPIFPTHGVVEGWDR